MQERLKEILKKESLTPAQLADKIGVQRSSISHILSGRNKPGFDFIQKILLSFPAIDAKWLITGQGTIYAERVKDSELFAENTEKAANMRPVADNESRSGSLDTKKKEEPAGKNEKTGEIEKIMVLYRDKTFREYSPDNK